MDFPRTVDEITPEWLTKVLRESGALSSAGVASIEQADLGSSQGAIAEVTRFRVEYDSEPQNAPRSLIFKSARAGLTPSDREFMFPMYDREVRFYKGLHRTIDFRLPQSHFAEFDRKTGKMAIVLEDLSTLRAEEEGTDLSIDDGHSTMRFLAKLHAT